MLLSNLIPTFVALFSTATAAFSEGKIDPRRDYTLSYDPSVYDTTLAFCTAFRASCIQQVGNLDQHHSLDCVSSQSNPIQAFCGGIQKTASGATGDGPVIDQTSIVCSLTTGCTLVAPNNGGNSSSSDLGVSPELFTPETTVFVLAPSIPSIVASIVTPFFPNFSNPATATLGTADTTLTGSGTSTITSDSLLPDPSLDTATATPTLGTTRSRSFTTLTRSVLASSSQLSSSTLTASLTTPTLDPLASLSSSSLTTSTPDLLPESTSTQIVIATASPSLSLLSPAAAATSVRVTSSLATPTSSSSAPSSASFMSSLFLSVTAGFILLFSL